MLLYIRNIICWAQMFPYLSSGKEQAMKNKRIMLELDLVSYKITLIY